MGLFTWEAKVVRNEAVITDKSIDVADFENFIRDYLFIKSEYVLLNKEHNFQTNQNDYKETSKELDFHFKSVNTVLIITTGLWNGAKTISSRDTRKWPVRLRSLWLSEYLERPLSHSRFS
jgi:hypothetical protein